MNKHLYIAGVSVLALVLSGVPAAAFAQDNGGSEGQGDGNAQIQARPVGAPAVGIVRSGEGEQSSEGEQQRQGLATSSANRITGSEETGEAQGEREMEREGVPFHLESTTTPVFSLAQLQQSIEQRKQELDQEAASSSLSNRSLVANANPVRLAVHALLASTDLVGSIGSQVSQIARQMNDSVASTTVAEAQIQSRGFLSRLLFGGDSSAAQAIDQAVAKNQANIQTLTGLLSQANISTEVKSTLEAQITALQDAQTRLQTLAQNEQKAWGIFSWRF